MRLTASGISCARGGRTLFTGLSFALSDGELMLLTGPNGSGKTSLLRQIAGLLPLESGSIVCEGFEREEETHFVGHLAALKDALTVSENLAFWVELYGGNAADLAGVLEKFRLDRLASLSARVLSAGQRRRLALARLAAIRRKLWLLDEPDTALDAEGRAMLVGVIAGHRAQGGTVVMASHGTLDAAPSQEISLAEVMRTAAA